MGSRRRARRRRPGGGCARRAATPSRRSQARAERRAARRGDGGGSGVRDCTPRGQGGGASGRRRVASVIAWVSSPRERRDWSRADAGRRAAGGWRRRLRELAAAAGLPFGAAGQARGRRCASSSTTPSPPPARRRPTSSACRADLGVATPDRDGVQVAAVVALAPERIRARYCEDDDDALVHLPTLARVARAFDAEGSGLHFAGDVNWGTFDLTRLHGLLDCCRWARCVCRRSAPASTARCRSRRVTRGDVFGRRAQPNADARPAGLAGAA